MGLHFGNYTASGRGLTTTKRGNCTIRGATRRRQVDSQLLMLQNPQYHQYGSRPTACRPCPQCPRATESHTMEQGRCHGERKLALQESHSPTCGTKLALLAQNGPIWQVLPVQGELYTAVTSNKPSRANFLPHQPQHHHGLDRNDAPTRHTKRRNETFSAPAPHTPPQHETFIAPARHKRPKITHFPHAGANFLSQHTPPTQHAPTPGRFFFQPPRQVQANQQSHAIPISPIPTQPHNPQDSNDQTSHHETHLRELHAKLLERWDQATVPVGGEPEHLPATLISDGGTPNKNRT